VAAPSPLLRALWWQRRIRGTFWCGSGPRRVAERTHGSAQGARRSVERWHGAGLGGWRRSHWNHRRVVVSEADHDVVHLVRPGRAERLTDGIAMDVHEPTLASVPAGGSPALTGAGFRRRSVGGVRTAHFPLPPPPGRRPFSRPKRRAQPKCGDIGTERRRQAGHHPTTLLVVEIAEDRLNLEGVRHPRAATVVREVLGGHPELIARVRKSAEDQPDGVDQVGLATVVLAHDQAEGSTEANRAIQVSETLEPYTIKLHRPVGCQKSARHCGPPITRRSARSWPL
jgi:hypothetical protein